MSPFSVGNLSIIFQMLCTVQKKVHYGGQNAQPLILQRCQIQVQKVKPAQICLWPQVLQLNQQIEAFVAQDKLWQGLLPGSGFDTSVK